MEALAFLKIKNADLAVNKFDSKKSAISFIKRLYKLGCLKITVDFLEDADGRLYSEAMDIVLPKSLSKRLDIAVAVLSEHPDDVSVSSDDWSQKFGKKLDWHKCKMISVWWD